MTALLLLALIPPFLWAVVNHIDKYAVESYMNDRDPGALILFTSLAAFLIGIIVLIFAPIQHLHLHTSAIMIGGGMLLVFAYIPYLYAIGKDETSNAAPLFQLITPLAYLLAFIFLGERIALKELLAGSMIFFGAIALSVDIGHMKLRRRTFFLMLLSSLMIAVNVVIFKGFALETSFWTTVFYDLLGAAIAGVVIIAASPRYRRDFMGAIRQHGSRVVSVNLVAESISVGARMVNGFVSLSLPIAIVQFINGLQPLFILVIGIVLTKFAPHLGEEAVDRRSLVRKFSAIILMCGGLSLLAFLV